jgi:hypothetical protein
MLHVGTAPGVSGADLVSPFSRYSMAPANVLGGPLTPPTSLPYQQQQVSLGQVSPAVTSRMTLVPPVTNSRGPAPPPVPPPLPPTLSKGGLRLLPTRKLAADTPAVQAAAPAVHVLDESLFDRGSPSAVAAAIAAGVDPGGQGLTERTALLASIRQGGFRLQHVARPSAMARQNESGMSGW